MAFPNPPGYTPVSGSKEERNWAMLCHVATLAGFVIPLGNIIGPLVIWLLKKDEYPLVNDQGKEAINFQISILIYLIVSAVLVLAVVGIVLVPAVLIFDIVSTIIAIMKANEGIAYRYRLTIRMIS
jgi:uncharacterized Tic20 family protein